MKTDDFVEPGSKIQITVASLDELAGYRSALLSVLRRVNINACDPQFKADLKTVYRLISKMRVTAVSEGATQRSELTQANEVLTLG